MSAMKIRIRMEAYDHQRRSMLLHARSLITPSRTAARVAGPIPLPTRGEIYTVNRSTFVNKKRANSSRSAPTKASSIFPNQTPAPSKH